MFLFKGYTPMAQFWLVTELQLHSQLPKILLQTVTENQHFLTSKKLKSLAIHNLPK